MRVERQTVYMGDSPAANSENAKKSSKSINASGLNKKFDPIAAKKAQAQKKALKVVGDVFDGERKIDEDLENRRVKIRKLTAENGEYRKAISDLEAQRESLRGEYGVAEDSQEEQDLRLLAKEADAARSGSGVRLTDGERKRLKEIKAGELTEYQKRSMELKDYEDYYWKSIEDNDTQIKTENAVIRGVESERLKTHAMVDAQKEAKSIMDAAGREIVGMLVEEAKDHVDEELEEKKEAAEKKAEEQEELEEKLDRAKEKKKEQEELTEDVLESVNELAVQVLDMKSARQGIQEIMDKMKLVTEDIKGAVVDKNL